ncbi:MAG: acyl-CoA dehydrogenase family protein [Polyangiales bacterium]
MTTAANVTTPLGPHDVGLATALQAIGQLYVDARKHVLAKVKSGEKLDGDALDRNQVAAHALAYLATELEACKHLALWAERGGGEYERTIAKAYVAEVARGLRASIELGPLESVGIAELGVDVRATVGLPAVVAFADRFASDEAYLAIAKEARQRPADARGGAHGLDETLAAMKTEFRKFVLAEVEPIAQPVHQKDALIPIALVRKMAEMGVFGLTIPEAYGGLGQSKVAMCVVTEELSRGYIGVGSLGTRAEIAAELILAGGTDAQKQRWLPALASGEALSTAVFTEPNFGSDLAHIKSRAEKQADGAWKLFGQKTWITHATRANLMTVLARSDATDPGYGGCSMVLVEKASCPDDASGAALWPDKGLTGTEIRVLGYRGMKEFEISFDGFTAPADALLGGVEGKGFKQLMATFESARVQTAARGVGVAQNAIDLAFRYAEERVQFGKPIADFPRVARKLGRMIARTQAARQLTHYAAQKKDEGKRCDLEAGMAKLLATKAAWECADAGVQIHGGNGYAEEYAISRLLVDARVLSIFEGANEIQAHVVARRLLEG